MKIFVLKYRYLLLAALVLLAALLRFYHLSTTPPSPSWDEVAWGYNSYALSVDGKDEFGRFLPITYFESFGDFKPPVYAYLGVIPTVIWGMGTFAARFPSAFFGTLTVLVTYFLARRIFYTSWYKEYIALLSAGILAISPWHINLSRAAFEANVSSFFIISGIWLFLESVREKSIAKKNVWLLVPSAICFAISIYTFNTARIVSPLLVGVLAIGFYKTLLQQKKQVIVAAVVGALIVLPTVPFLLSPQAGLRFKEVNIFSDLTVIERVNQEIANDGNAKWSKAIHHRYLTYGAEFVKHYLDNFNPAFLFISGDGNPRFSTQDVGELYIWDLLFLVIGGIMMFKRKEGTWWLIPIWLIVGVIPAATARETPHALRIETVLPTFQMIVAYGLIEALIFLRRLKISYLLPGIVLILGTVLGINVLYYLHGYYAHYSREYSQEWQYGYADAISYVDSVQDKYDAIYGTELLGRPYVYFLFYNRTDPRDFRKTADIERDAFGFVHVKGYGKFHFEASTDQMRGQGNYLFLARPEEVPDGVHIVKKFNLLNGDPALVAYTLK